MPLPTFLRLAVPARGFARLALALLLGTVALGTGCGGSGSDAPPGGGGGGGTIPACAGTTGPFRVLSGVVRYERLVLKPTGIGPETELRPARYIDMEIRAQADGACLARGTTDGNGAYAISLGVPDGTVMQVVVFSRTAFDPARDYTVHQADPPLIDVHDPNNVFTHVVGDVPGMGSQVVDVTVPYAGAPGRPAIGFGLLDTIATCMDQVALAVAPRPVGPVNAYTRLGNNGALGGVSFFRPIARALAVLGGAAGNEDNSDTDYFDDAVVAHELGHHIESLLSHQISRGGPHGGEPLEPGFAFSEGQATGFGCALLREPLYVDSTTTSNNLFFNFNVENATGPGDPPGIGGELTVAEIIWDLFDGAPLDTDGDNTETSLPSLIAALTSFQPAVDAPYIGLFLDRVVTAPGSTVTAADITTLMGAPENQGITYPVPASEVFPTPIQVGGPAQAGTLDSQPAPFKNPCRGLTSSAWFRLSIPAQSTVNIFLDVQPIAGSGDNLDLFLCTNADVNGSLASSTNGGAADEAITHPLGAGEYIVRVEANCSAGNRASFSLTVTP